MKKKEVEKPRKVSKGEALFIRHLEAYKIAYEREYRFHPVRRWRFDFLIDDVIAVEIEGGTWINGAHNRGKHYESDCQKYNEAALMGYKVLRFTTDMVKSGQAIDTIRRALGVVVR